MVRVGRAAGHVDIHVDLLVQGHDRIEQRRQPFAGKGAGRVGGFGGVVALLDLLVGKAVGQGGNAAMGGAGAQGDDDLAALAKGLGHLHVLLVAQPAAEDAHIGLGDLDMLSGAQLAEVFVIHERRQMDELCHLEHVQQPLAHIDDGDFTA